MKDLNASMKLQAYVLILAHAVDYVGQNNYTLFFFENLGVKELHNSRVGVSALRLRKSRQPSATKDK